MKLDFGELPNKIIVILAKYPALVLGVFLVLVGALGGLPFGGQSLPAMNVIWRSILAGIGSFLLIIGIVLIFLRIFIRPSDSKIIVVVHEKGDKITKIEGATVTLSLPRLIEQPTDKSGTAIIFYPSAINGEKIDLNVTKAGYQLRQPETITLKNGSTVYLALIPRVYDGGSSHDIKRYLQSMKTKFSLWRGLGLGRDVVLEEIYVSHRLENGKEEILSDDNLLKLLTNISPDKQNVLIIGQAGSGKTTLLKRWVLLLADRALKANCQDWIPIYVSLGLVGVLCGDDPDWHGSVVEIAADEFTDINDTVPPSLIEALTKVVNSGNAIILLDAADEVAEITRPHILRWIEKMQRTSQCPIVVTSRPSPSVDNMVNFQLFKVKPFESNQIQSFVNKWFEDALTDANRMIELLGKSDQLKLLAGNPLFLTLMCVTYENEHFMQSYTAGDLLERFVWTLLQDWDIDKGGRRGYARSKSNVAAELHVLESVSVQFFGQIEIKEVELLDCVRMALEEYGSPLDAQSVIQDIQSVSGILLSGRGGRYRFCHPLFPDFFYACHLLQEVKEGRLNWQDWTRETGEKEKYHNVDVLFRDLLDRYFKAEV